MSKKGLIGIIGAMDIEVDALVESMTKKKEKIIGAIKFVQGRMGEQEVVVAKCGIGKVFAGICAQTMILEFNPTLIVNTGVAGTLDSSLGVLDVAISENVVQHDMDTSALGDPIGLISGINIVYIGAEQGAINLLKNTVISLGNKAVIGTIASGDRFVSNDEDKIKIKEHFSAIACEMEGGAIGQVCYVNKVPFVVLRVISDGDGAEMDYMTFSKEAASKSIKIIKEFIKNYK